MRANENRVLAGQANRLGLFDSVTSIQRRQIISQ